MITLYNTLKRKKDILRPIEPGLIKMYTCGPTVYFYAHIGNLRTYLFEDILKRTLIYNGYKIKHVMNITDVGHLTSDQDTGEDKIEKGSKREGLSAYEIAEKYTEAFKLDIKKLNIIDPNVWMKATDTIQEQIDFIKKLEERGYTYVIEDGVYFNTFKIKDYGKLANLKNVDLLPGARVEMVRGKKNITDFALWKLTPEGENRQMEWDSPWGKGTPGWHTECIVMAEKSLGIPFDIHCGGIDHIPVHHTNEIAQSEAMYNSDMANIWMHGEFMNINGEKMAKSQSNILTLEYIKEQGFHPLVYRYFVLGAHYRTNMNFSLSALQGAKTGLKSLINKVRELSGEKGEVNSKYKEEFLSCINDDLNTPQALAVTWKMLRSNISNKDKYATLLSFDEVFGLGFDKILKEDIPEDIKQLAKERETYRKRNNFEKADHVRKEIEEKGYNIEDTPSGVKIKKYE